MICHVTTPLEMGWAKWRYHSLTQGSFDKIHFSKFPFVIDWPCDQSRNVSPWSGSILGESASVDIDCSTKPCGDYTGTIRWTRKSVTNICTSLLLPPPEPKDLFWLSPVNKPSLAGCPDPLMNGFPGGRRAICLREWHKAVTHWASSRPTRRYWWYQSKR